MTYFADALQASAILTLVLAAKMYYSFITLGSAKSKAGLRAPEDLYQHSAAAGSDDTLAWADRAQRIV